jgi:ABC-type transport system involved in cytochrome bd biosynthesis fused ATPase/permease subunit
MNALILIGLPVILGAGILVVLMLMARIMPPPADRKPQAADATVAATPVPARGPEYIKYQAQRILSYRRGLVVFLGLAILTAVELAIALTTGNLVPIAIIALGKAALILNYFMHVRTVWVEEAH